MFCLYSSLSTNLFKATPNWTLVSRPPILENMMQAGGVLCIIVNMINIGAQTLHHCTGKKSKYDNF